MEFLHSFLPILIYMLLIVLLVVLIIIGIKAIILMNRVSVVVDDVEKKVKSLNGVFNVINNVSSRINFIYDKIADRLFGLFTRGKKDKEDIDE